jgi:hypothetical protein
MSGFALSLSAYAPVAIGRDATLGVFSGATVVPYADELPARGG